MRALPHLLFGILLSVFLSTLGGCLTPQENAVIDAVKLPLVQAASEGNSQAVRALLEHGQREGMDYALVASDYQGSTEVAQVLLDHGASVDAIPYGWQQTALTPLHLPDVLSLFACC